MTTSNKFSKFHGGGNDFILFEDFEEAFPLEKIPSLCNRQMGIGADGLILARKSSVADFSMLYFNADGTEAFCGNGLRCFVHFLQIRGHNQEAFLIESSGNVLTVKADGEKISTFLPRPKEMKEYLLHDTKIFVVDTGVPHAVVFSTKKSLGKTIREHPTFHPEGVNVNFVEKEGKLYLSTYERGVEGETLACGTGAAAASFVANQLGHSSHKVQVVTKSEAILEVAIGDEIEVVGPSEKVFEGTIEF